MRFFWLLVGLLLTLVTVAGAATYAVRPDRAGDRATIQDAVDTAVDGDFLKPEIGGQVETRRAVLVR